jgi:hypothetical protein
MSPSEEHVMFLKRQIEWLVDARDSAERASAACKKLDDDWRPPGKPHNEVRSAILEGQKEVGERFFFNAQSSLRGLVDVLEAAVRRLQQNPELAPFVNRAVEDRDSQRG